MDLLPSNMNILTPPTSVTATGHSASHEDVSKGIVHNKIPSSAQCSRHPTTHYVTPECVLNVNYGEVTEAVNKHFDRALHIPSASDSIGNAMDYSLPWSERKLPKSFWNPGAKIRMGNRRHRAFCQRITAYNKELYKSRMFSSYQPPAILPGYSTATFNNHIVQPTQSPLCHETAAYWCEPRRFDSHYNRSNPWHQTNVNQDYFNNSNCVNPSTQYHRPPVIAHTSLATTTVTSCSMITSSSDDSNNSPVLMPPKTSFSQSHYHDLALTIPNEAPSAPTPVLISHDSSAHNSWPPPPVSNSTDYTNSPCYSSMLPATGPSSPEGHPMYPSQYHNHSNGFHQSQNWY